MPTLSVALCTYNGERYLAEQLESLRAQTRPPDELIVFDDQSVDDTVELLRRFAAAAPFRVEIDDGCPNVGSTKNFERAIRRCTGDYIALCDQDDVWMPDKLAVMTAGLDANDDCGFAFSDAELVDDGGRRLGSRLWKSVGFRPRLRRRHAHRLRDALLRRHVVTGATMVFRSRLRDRILPISDRWVHDGWIALILSLEGRCLVEPRPLIEYRQHAGQQIGAPNAPRSGALLREAWRLVSGASSGAPGFHKRLAETRSQLEDVVDHLKRIKPARAADADKNLRLIADKVAHLDARVRTAQDQQRYATVWREYWSGRYRRYSLGLLSAARDLMGV